MSYVIGFAYLILAFLYLHKALPRITAVNKLDAIRLWLFACVLSIFSLAFLFGVEVDTTRTLGHICLILYSSFKLHSIFSNTPKCHWYSSSVHSI